MTDGFSPNMFSLTKWVLHKIWEVMKLSPWIQVAVSPPASETSLSQSGMSKSSWGDFKWATFVPWKSFRETKNFIRKLKGRFHHADIHRRGFSGTQELFKRCGETWYYILLSFYLEVGVLSYSTTAIKSSHKMIRWRT